MPFTPTVEKVAHDALCKAITTNPFWSSGEWSAGLCDGRDAATNRTQMLGAFDAALKSLAKEKQGLTDPAGAFGGRTDGSERLYLSDSRRAVFGGFAPTELYADEVESSTRKEACADSGLVEKDCKLHGAIRSAFTTKVHDAP